MSLPKTQLFDEMIPFFGLKNDHRIRLYLHALYAEWLASDEAVVRFTIRNKKGWGTSTVAAPRYELQSKNFENGESNDMTVHPEWENFRTDLITRLTDKSIENFNSGVGPRSVLVDCINDVPGSEVLQVIKNIGNRSLSDNSELTRFLVNVINAHCRVIVNSTAGLKNATHQREWSDAVDFHFLNYSSMNYIFEEVLDKYIVSACTTNVRNFNFRLTKYILQLFIEERADQSMTVSAPSQSDSFWNMDEPIVDEYYRKHPDTEKLYKIDTKDNVEVEVNSNEAFKKVMTKEKDVCHVVQGTNDGANTCNDYIVKCVMDGSRPNIDNCKQYMKSTLFWSNIKKEVNDMLPTVIVDTLDSFGFETQKNSDGYVMYRSVNDWLKRLKTYLTGPTADDDYKSISENIKLIEYLTLLVAKVNANPAILNNNYFTKAQSSDASLDARFRDTYLRNIGVTPALTFVNNVKDTININQITGVLSSNNMMRRNSYYVMVNPSGKVLVNGAPYVIGAPVTYYLRGGAALTSSSTGATVAQSIQTNTKMVEDTINNLINALLFKNKDLDVNTRSQLFALLKSYKDTGTKLAKAIYYTDAYVEAIDHLKLNDPNGILTMDGIKNFVDTRTKYENQLDKKEVNIINALQLLVEMLDKRLDNNTPPTPPSYHTGRV